ncbi:hypothetical protein CCACVL1_08387 [Corchorus capsularis]|uniref:Uncharacterized protein n=1 Tax=Corchorus capsularis TaxID=210143 RepID=A0A1R3J0Y4_COCAP|nr:hypothetical protein CCACVL1_08387 [Corchorus capsularis]
MAKILSLSGLNVNFNKNMKIS